MQVLNKNIEGQLFSHFLGKACGCLRETEVGRIQGQDELCHGACVLCYRSPFLSNVLPLLVLVLVLVVGSNLSTLDVQALTHHLTMIRSLCLCPYSFHSHASPSQTELMT